MFNILNVRMVHTVIQYFQTANSLFLIWSLYGKHNCFTNPMQASLLCITNMRLTKSKSCLQINFPDGRLITFTMRLYKLGFLIKFSKIEHVCLLLNVTDNDILSYIIVYCNAPVGEKHCQYHSTKRRNFLGGHGSFACEIIYLTPIVYGRFALTIVMVKRPYTFAIE